MVSKCGGLQLVVNKLNACLNIIMVVVVLSGRAGCIVKQAPNLLNYPCQLVTILNTKYTD